MKITELQLYSALNEFIEREIMPLSASMDTTKQFVFGLKIGIVKHRIESVVKGFLNKEEFKMLELVDEKGNIDIEPIYKSAMDMMRKMQRLEISGFTFRESDLMNLHSIILKYADKE
jgi:hypothetical protein